MRSMAVLTFVLLFACAGLAALDACTTVAPVEVAAALRGPGTMKAFHTQLDNSHLSTCIYRRLSHPGTEQENIEAVKNQTGPLLSITFGDEMVVKSNAFATESGVTDTDLQGLGDRAVLRRGSNFVAVVIWTSGQVLRVELAHSQSKTQADDIQDIAREAASSGAVKDVAYFPVTDRAFASDRATLNLPEVCSILYHSNFVSSAVPYCEEVVKDNPKDSWSRIVLALVYARQSAITRDPAQRLSLSDKAIEQCQRVVRDDPQNQQAIKELAVLFFARALETQNAEEKFRALEQTRGYVLDALKADPKDPGSYYTIGVIDWTEAYRTRIDAKSAAGILPESPIENQNLCSDLQAKNWNKVTDASENLNEALKLRPDYDDAMAYLNLVYREKADLECGNSEARKQDLALADDWVRKTMETKRAKAVQNSPATSGNLAVSSGGYPWMVTPPPPPPPLPPGVVPMSVVGKDGKPIQGVLGGIVGSTLPPPRISSGQGVQLVRVSSGVVAGNKISGPDPEYPSIAKTARIQGTVVLQATISRTGEIESLSAVGGPPMLYQAAIDAVKQWRYRPYVLNGEVVEVETTIQVNFTLNGDTPSPQE